jgi:hypothetical protein
MVPGRGERVWIGSGHWTPVRRIERCKQECCESSSLPSGLLGAQLACFTFWTAQITTTGTSTGIGLYWGCLKISTMSLPRSICACVLASGSEPRRHQRTPSQYRIPLDCLGVSLHLSGKW